ncbi:unnamed protein product [Rotaria sordida]|uniref:Uncharacterized protein n=1 Tax=Rotaria sordida TaxID=392033 RepID=A0A815AA39_9BILA|nr:unnamed protein product [Rotaria sordida]CAF1252806.1 unnamed protein product [Rotaria sordida]CAF3672175.1 unnamed protein product [Rotaria sordida]CAF4093842.1 unnamed protein product [Rotaria sordida]
MLFSLSTPSSKPTSAFDVFEAFFSDQQQNSQSSFSTAQSSPPTFVFGASSRSQSPVAFSQQVPLFGFSSSDSS